MLPGAPPRAEEHVLAGGGVERRLAGNERDPPGEQGEEIVRVGQLRGRGAGEVRWS